MGNVQDVEVGPILNQSHAEEVAEEYIRTHPEYEWTGHWNNTVPGEVATIQIRRKEVGPSGVDDLLRSSRPYSSHRSSFTSRNEETSHQSVFPGLDSAFQTLQQGLTSFIEDRLNDALSSQEGQSSSYGQRSQRTLTSSNSFPSDWEVLDTADNDDDTDEDTDEEQDQFHSFPRSPTPPSQENLAEELINRSTFEEPGPSSQFNASATTVDAPTCSEVSKLVDMFPDTDEIIICELLENNNYDVDKTIEVLLQLSSSPSSSTQPQGDTIPKGTSNSSLPTPTCPVCYEAMKPPRRIFQCNNGHLLCEACKNQPKLKGCPTCRQPIMGRATAMEQFLADLQDFPQSKH